MKKDLPFYRQLFTAMFKLSAFTFGGGYVIIPLMRKKFVAERHWIDEQEMLDLTAIAQSSPGAIAVNASILVGYRLAGLPGSLVAVLGTVLPPFLVLSFISMFYTQFRDNVLVGKFLKGMQAGVVAVIADAVFVMGRDIVRQKEVVSIAVMAAAFFASWFFHFPVVLIILAGGLLGTAAALVRSRRRAAGVSR
ncbi:MAG: chromate transporter [Clostridiaceae bacterium]|nr:chromate transporter [Clostridiaceae bacterium]